MQIGKLRTIRSVKWTMTLVFLVLCGKKFTRVSVVKYTKQSNVQIYRHVRNVKQLTYQIRWSQLRARLWRIHLLTQWRAQQPLMPFPRLKVLSVRIWFSIMIEFLFFLYMSKVIAYLFDIMWRKIFKLYYNKFIMVII